MLARWMLLISTLVACAHERPTAPRPPEQPPATAPKRPRGKLVVRHLQVGLAVCAPEAKCAPVAGLPEKVTTVVQNGPARYLVSNASASYEYNVVTNAIEELVGAGPGVITHLEDGSSLRYDHLATHSRVLRRAPGENWMALLEYEKGRPLEFRFLPDGRHLFKSSPGMGGPESPHFTDLILGHPTHLLVAEGVGKKARRVHSSSQQMDADFLDEGRRVAWWQPGEVTEASNERRIALQVLELASGKVTDVETVITPVGRRDAPDTSSSLRSTWIVYARELTLRAHDVASGRHGDHPLSDGEHLAASMPHDSTWPRRNRRRWSDHVIVEKRLSDVTELAVLSVPSFNIVFRTNVPTLGFQGADWIETQ